MFSILPELGLSANYRWEGRALLAEFFVDGVQVELHHCLLVPEKAPLEEIALALQEMMHRTGPIPQSVWPQFAGKRLKTFDGVLIFSEQLEDGLLQAAEYRHFSKLKGDRLMAWTLCETGHFIRD